MNTLGQFNGEFSIDEKNFIKNNLTEKIENLLLKEGKNKPQNIKKLAEQILGRQKIKEKLPSWYHNFDLILPKSISLEQSSSESTANYKSKIVEGKLLIDLTGGMGIDFFAMCKNFETAIYVDQNHDLKAIAEHNSAQLGFKNNLFESENSVSFIEKFNKKADWIYMDPARRDSSGGKVFTLADCEPNIITIKDALFAKSDNILLKCSPMLDIDLAINQLEYVKKVYIISVGNEVKELLFHLNKTKKEPIEIVVVQITKDNINEFRFEISQEKALENVIAPVQKYLYEPHAGIMKAGGYKTISKIFGCPKLNPNTHLYTSGALIENFPGRIFEITDTINANKNALKNKIQNQKANLSIRNFPGNVDELKKKLGIKDGGNLYIFACTNHLNEKILLLTTKIN